MADTSILSPDDLNEFKGILNGTPDPAPVQAPPSTLTPQDKQEFNELRAQTAVAQRSAGRQWLGGQAVQDFSNLRNKVISDPDNYKAGAQGNLNMGDYLTPAKIALEGASGLWQGAENVGAHIADYMTGSKASKNVPANAPMEFGDVLAAQGMPEWAAKTGGLAMGGAIPGPQQMIGSAAGNVLNNGVQGARSAVLNNFFPGAGASLMRKSPAAVKYMIDNPDAVFTKDNMQNAGETAQNLANEMSQRIEGVKQTSRSLYQQAAKSATDAPINPQLGQQSAALMQGHLTNEINPENILNQPAWREEPNVNTYSMTHNYQLPQETGILDENGNMITRPGVHTARGTVVSQQGPNVSKETQNFAYPPEGAPSVTGVSTANSTSTKTPLANVSVGEALDRMQTGQPVSVKQLASLRNTLQGLRKTSSTAGQMSDEALDLLGQHDSNFAQAAGAWRDYKTLTGDRGAQSLYGGISSDYNKNIDPTQQVVGNNSEGLLNYFNNPETSKAAAAPALADKILSQYGPATNYEARIKALSAGEGMHEWTPRGHFAVGALVGGAGAHMLEEVPGGAMIAGHPAVQAAGAAAGLGIIAGSSRALSRNVIRALVAQKAAPAGAGKLLESPAGRYLQSSFNPAALATIAGMKGAEQNHDDSYQQQGAQQ